MELYRELYYRLFAAMADAVEAIERDEPEAARDLLVAAQQEAEERVIEQVEIKEDTKVKEE